jgi:hypothetical protein
MGHAEQDLCGLLVGRVVEVEAKILPLHRVVEGSVDTVSRENLLYEVLLVRMEVKALWAGARQEGDWAGDGWGIANPGLYLRMKGLGARARVNALADDVVLGIKEAGFGQEGLGLFVLAQETGFAGLLYEFADVPLMSDGIRFGVVAVGWVELDRFVELNLGAGEVVALKQAGSSQISVLSCLDLMFCGSA